MAKGFFYMLLCSNGMYYSGSTINLELRLKQHWTGSGANFTRKYPPEELVYVEEFERVDQAFYREKQVQGWSHSKKKALIDGDINLLHDLSVCNNASHYLNKYKKGK